MLYNVLDSSGNVIGHVEADNPIEAWAKAREIYEATGSMVSDVRLSEGLSKEVAGWRYCSYCQRLVGYDGIKYISHYTFCPHYYELEEERKQRLAGIVPHEFPELARIKEDLRISMNEEASASISYRSRAENAGRNGDFITQRLWEHIAEEEDGHYNEFKNRLIIL